MLVILFDKAIESIISQSKENVKFFIKYVKNIKCGIYKNIQP